MTPTGPSVRLTRRALLKGAGKMALVSYLAACGSAGSSSTEEDVFAVTLKSNRSGQAGQTNDGQPLADLLAAYRRETRQRVDVTIVDHNQFQSNGNPLAYLMEQPPPDVLTWFPGERMRYYVSKGLLLDISDLIAKVSGFSPAIKDLISARAGLGKQYLMPTDYFWHACYYRRSVFQQHGYTVPATWDSLI